MKKKQKLSEVCDRCGQSPEKFECGDNDNGDEMIGYYHIIPRECTDPVILMSDGTEQFKIALSPFHPILKDEVFICTECFIEMFGDILDEEEE